MLTDVVNNLSGFSDISEAILVISVALLSLRLLYYGYFMLSSFFLWHKTGHEGFANNVMYYRDKALFRD